MIEIQGEYNTAKCFTDNLEEAAARQILSVCDQPAFAGCKLRIMPDVHAGMGCTIGTTMTIRDKIVPGMVGVDIGCGMETVKLAEKEIDFAALDALIRAKIHVDIINFLHNFFLQIYIIIILVKRKRK